ncbi:MAG: HPF/RaiA family ribosome-associated protein [Hyphomicrobium sp.]
MQTPLEIEFNGVEKSDALEAKITEKFNKLLRHFSRMSSCRVVVARPHRHSKGANPFLIKIEVGVPGQQTVLISSAREDDREHEDIQIALRDAFDAAKRKLDELAAKLSRGAQAKAERGRRRPAKISPPAPDSGEI